MALREQVGLRSCWRAGFGRAGDAASGAPAELQACSVPDFRFFFGPRFRIGAALSLLQNAVCLCQPSRDEGLGLSILEALAASCPAVTPTVQLPEWPGMMPGRFCRFDRRDCQRMRGCADNPARRASDGRSGRLLVERSSPGISSPDRPGTCTCRPSGGRRQRFRSMRRNDARPGSNQWFICCHGSSSHTGASRRAWPTHLPAARSAAAGGPHRHRLWRPLLLPCAV